MKNKITLDLNRLNLTPEESDMLKASIAKLVTKEITKKNVKRSKTAKPKNVSLKHVSSLSNEHETATLSATFLEVDPGVSTLTVYVHDEEQTLHKTDSLELGSMSSGDIVTLHYDGGGKVSVNINVPTTPTTCNLSDTRPDGAFLII